MTSLTWRLSGINWPSSSWGQNTKEQNRFQMIFNDWESDVEPKNLWSESNFYLCYHFIGLFRSFFFHSSFVVFAFFFSRLCVSTDDLRQLLLYFEVAKSIIADVIRRQSMTRWSYAICITRTQRQSYCFSLAVTLFWFRRVHCTHLSDTNRYTN